MAIPYQAVTIAFLGTLVSLCSAETDLRSRARELLNSHDPNLVLSAPSLRIVVGQLRASRGQVFIRQGSNIRDKSILERALTVEQLRRSVASAPGLASPLWSAMFTRIDRSLIDAQSKIQRGVAPSTVLAEFDGKFSSDFVAAAGAVAAQKRVKLKIIDGTRVRLIDVTFQSEPPGAELEIVNQFYFEAFDQKPPSAYWSDVRTVPTRRIPTGGWTYRARWRRGDRWQVHTIDIDRPQTIKIRRDR